jgi:flagellar motor protein MotB
MRRPLLDDEEQPARVPGWAMTYIDLLWLLLLFFILRSAVGDGGTSHHYREITDALNKRFGSHTEAKPDAKKMIADAAKDRMSYAELEREGFAREAEAKKRQVLARGAIFFPEREIKLQSEQKLILQAVAERIGQTAETIEIRGEAAESKAESDRTDQPSIDPAYARCVAARDYLVKLGIEPRRLRIVVTEEKTQATERPRVQLYSITEMVAEKPGPAAR